MRLAAVVVATVCATGTARADGRDLPQLGTYDPNAIIAHAPGGLSPVTLTTGSALAVGGDVTSGDRECHIGDGDRIATAPGRAEVVCGGTRGQPRTEIAIVVAPVMVAAELRPLRVGVPTRVHLTVASVAQIGSELRVFGDRGLVVDRLDRTLRGIDVTVTAPAEGPYALAVTTPAGTELGRVDAEAIEAAPPRTITRDLGERSAWAAFDLGATVGFFAPGDTSPTIGRPARAGDSVGWGPLFGARIGWFPIRRVGLEVEAAVATTGYVDQGGVSAVLDTRAQIAVRAVEDGAYGLRLLAGADLLGELVDRGSSHRTATGGVHYGAAFTIEANPHTWLRFELLHVILPAADGDYASCFEAQLGVVTRFGRRDTSGPGRPGW